MSVPEKMAKLKKIATLIRYYILAATTEAGSGHPTSSLSATELMTALLFGGFFLLSSPGGTSTASPPARRPLPPAGEGRRIRAAAPRPGRPSCVYAVGTGSPLPLAHRR